MSKFKAGDRVRWDGFDSWQDCVVEYADHEGVFVKAAEGKGYLYDRHAVLIAPPVSDEIQELRAFKAEALAAGYAPKAAVDGDLLEARAIVAATYQSLDEREWDHYANSLIAGKNDDDVEVKCALAGVKRGRELAAMETGK